MGSGVTPCCISLELHPPVEAVPGHVAEQFLTRVKPHLVQVHVHHICSINLQEHSIVVAEHLLQLLDGGELWNLGAVVPGGRAEFHVLGLN